MADVVVVAGIFNEGGGVALLNRYGGLLKSLKHAGYETSFISNLKSFKFDECDHSICILESGDSWLSRRLQVRFFEYYLHKSLSKIDRSCISAVIVPMSRVNIRMLLVNRLIWKLPIVVDCMEWHEHWQFKYGVMSIAYWRFIWRFHFVVHYVSAVLAISSYLTKHFHSRGKKVLRLFPQIDVSQMNAHVEKSSDHCLKLFYAGTPFKKDNLATVVYAIADLEPCEIARLQFTIAGVSKAELLSILDNNKFSCIELVISRLRILGRIDRKDVVRELSRSDFMVLIRDNSRYSDSGFPSKVTESLGAGVPVIANITSDLGEILVDGDNSIVSSSASVQDVTKAIRRALVLSETEILRMSRLSTLSAQRHFDYSVASSDIKSFLNDLR